MRKIWSTAAVLATTLALLAGCGGSSQPAPAPAPQSSPSSQATPAPQANQPLKVGFVYIGPPGDGGYTFEHDRGRKYAEQQLGNKIKVTPMENVPEGADAERSIEQLVNDGNKLIFTTSFGYMDPTLNVAKRHPDVIFMHASGYKTNANMGTYFGWNHQGWYLAGIAAGVNLKPGHTMIGMVAAYPIPEVIRAINALEMGAKSVNPDATVKVVWSNTWFDPQKEKQAAESLLADGAEILAMYQDSPATLQAAEAKGKLSIGNDSDAHQYAPKSFLTAPVWNWGPYYTKVIQSVLDKTWKSEQYMGGIADGLVTLAPLNNVGDPSAKDKVQAAMDKIKGGWEPLSGPLVDQDGKERIPAGKAMTADQLLSMDWFVKGVIGTIPKS